MQWELTTYLFLILQFLQDSISQGFISAISSGKYEKGH